MQHNWFNYRILFNKSYTKILIPGGEVNEKDSKSTGYSNVHNNTLQCGLILGASTIKKVTATADSSIKMYFDDEKIIGTPLKYNNTYYIPVSALNDMGIEYSYNKTSKKLEFSYACEEE